MALGTGPLAGLTLRGPDPLGVPLFGEHPFREIQPLFDIGEAPLHVLERVKSGLNVFTPPYPLLQVVDHLRQVAPRPPWPAPVLRHLDGVPCVRCHSPYPPSADIIWDAPPPGARTPWNSQADRCSESAHAARTILGPSTGRDGLPAAPRRVVSRGPARPP